MLNASKLNSTLVGAGYAVLTLCVAAIFVTAFAPTVI